LARNARAGEIASLEPGEGGGRRGLGRKRKGVEEGNLPDERRASPATTGAFVKRWGGGSGFEKEGGLDPQRGPKPFGLWGGGN